MRRISFDTLSKLRTSLVMPFVRFDAARLLASVSGYFRTMTGQVMCASRIACLAAGRRAVLLLSAGWFVVSAGAAESPENGISATSASEPSAVGVQVFPEEGTPTVGAAAYLENQSSAAGVPNLSSIEAGRVDFFAGVDFNYRDQFHNHIYELLIYLTPGVKWYMGHGWQLGAQALVPVYNDYGDRYKKVRLNMAVLSKEWDWNRKLFVKASTGLFGLERYGFDVKAMWPVTDWLALDAQAGLTGYCSMAVDWECSKMERLTALAGVRVYINKVNTEFRARAGQFLYKDKGVQGEAMRHFRHCTVGLYAQYTNVGKDNYGFKIVMMVPPYKRSARKVRFRPASNFRFTYNQQGDPLGAKMYTTDPEENEREGWFDRSRLDWGANRMTPDFPVQKGGRR